MFSSEVVRAAREALEATAKEQETLALLDALRAYADDGDLPEGTVWRFTKRYTEATGGIPGEYTYVAYKAPTKQWFVTGIRGGLDWDDFVFWLLTTGEPVYRAQIKSLTVAEAIADI